MHIDIQTENSECSNCALQTLKKKLNKKKQKKEMKKMVKKNTIIADGVIINTLNGEVLGFTTSGITDINL